jgi:adenylate cyclase class 2
MAIEHEAKILDIDPEAMNDLILAKGGQRHRDLFMRRYVYDITPGDATTWIRLRDTGHDTTITVKKITDDTIAGTLENEVTVNDFDQAHQLLAAMGFRHKSYQENRRTSYTLAGAHLEIDSWPHLPPYLEIEADTTDQVITTAALLGYPETQLCTDNTITLYAHHGIDLNTTPELRF